MNAKEYLSQLILADRRLKNRIRQLDELKARALSLGGFDFSEDRIMTSSAGDTVAERVTRYVMLEKEINDEWDGYIDLKDKIIREINELDNPNHIMLLGLRYAEAKNLKDIAKEMGYHYDTIKHMHGIALQAFARKHQLSTQKHLEG